jgi:COP9 signalosome complex subunit 5
MKNVFYVLDAFALPVTGTETRVNAGSEADSYLFTHLGFCEEVGRAENSCGWYHSHPGYLPWLSNIDIGTQSLY